MVLNDVPGYERVVYEALLVVAVPFTVQKLTDVKATFEGEQGSLAEMDYGTDFTVAVSDGILYFTITAGFVPPETYGDILIYRDVVVEQSLAIPSGKEIPRKPLEWLLDRIVWMLQEIRRGLGDILLSVDPDSPQYELPGKETRKNKGLGYNSDGEPEVYDLPDRYPTSNFIREAYVAAVDQRSYADTFRLASQPVDESYIRSMIAQWYRMKAWNPVTDFTGMVIENIYGGLSAEDRYISGGRVAYLYVQILGHTEQSIVRLGFDKSLTLIRSQFPLVDATFLSTGNENTFFIGNQKGSMVMVNTTTLVENLFAFDIWKGATTPIVANGSIAYYFQFQGELATADYKLHYTTDIDNPYGVWTTVDDPTSEELRVTMRSFGYGDRMTFIAASYASMWETEDPTGTWTRLGTFINQGFRKGLCYSLYYQKYFSFCILLDGADVSIELESSDTGDTWEHVMSIPLGQGILGSYSIIGGALTYSEQDSIYKTAAPMQADSEVGTITIHYANYKFTIQPSAEYSVDTIEGDAQYNQSLYVKGLGTTIDFNTRMYLDSAIPLIPTSGVLPSDVIIAFDDNVDFIIAYDDNPDYLIINEE